VPLGQAAQHTEVFYRGRREVLSAGHMARTECIVGASWSSA